ncbi:MAG: hypothetical protein DRJ03_26300, partial [Chloroflexi bacterium]
MDNNVPSVARRKIFSPGCTVHVSTDRPVQILVKPLRGDINANLQAFVDYVGDDNFSVWAQYPEAIAVAI